MLKENTAAFLEARVPLGVRTGWVRQNIEECGRKVMWQEGIIISLTCVRILSFSRCLLLAE